MSKEALFWHKYEDNTGKTIKCHLCPRNCIIKNGKRGNCGVRENQNGKLYSLVYAKPLSVNLDPIEKKPLFHFLPGEETVSLGTAGCNLHCMFCQNYEISQAKPEIAKEKILPGQIIEKCKEVKSKIISYTYTEPTVFYEYMFETAELAKRGFLKNVMVSNGFINPEPLQKLIPMLDAVNIDLKGDSDFYRKVTGSWIEPVLESLTELKKKKVWLEVTNLIVPTMNDSNEKIKWLVKWIYDNLGPDTPVHFSAFWPYYKLENLPRTSFEKLKQARKIAIDQGLRYVYTGNVDGDGNNTYCPKCKKVVIKREGFRVVENNLKKGKCSCGERIAGVWS